MQFYFGHSMPRGVSQLFEQRAKEDGHQVIFDGMKTYASTEAFTDASGIGNRKGEPKVVFQSMARANNLSANDYATQLLITGHTLKKYDPDAPLWAVVPFGLFARQDQEREGLMDSVASEWFADALKHAGYSGVTTIEIHSDKAAQFFRDSFENDNFINIDPSEIYEQDLHNMDLYNPVVVSPDKGANNRADTLAMMLGADRFQIDKERRKIENVRIIGHTGDVKGRDAIIVDDMVDTGGTVMKAVELLKEQGARRIFVYAAHPVLSNGALGKIVRMNTPGMEPVIDRVRFLNTIARQSELDTVSDECGSAADGVGFLSSAEMLYEHVTQTIARHPAMQRALKA